MSSIDGSHLSGMVTAIAERLAAQRDALNALDSALGDGDHGTGISTAFMAAAEAVAGLEDNSPMNVLRVTGSTLMNRMGGASGALFGTLFMRAALSTKEHAVLGLPEVKAMWEAGLEGVQQRGKAEPGDKTMVDALAPAVAAFSAASSFAEAWQQAADAAATGADKTREMIAKHGRARFTAERAIGHIDAGARSVELMFAALNDYWKDQTT